MSIVLAAGKGIGAGLSGFLVVLGLVVVAVLLFRSMNRHLGKVPREFPPPPEPPAPSAEPDAADAGPAQSSRD